MKPWQRWLLLGLAVAVPAHLLTVWAVPRLIMREAMTRIGDETALQARAQGAPAAATGVYLPPPTDHTQRRIVMPSPDLLYATCTADLAQRPLRVSAQVAHPRYWSVALYGADSDNFFVVNDRKTAEPGRLDLWVVAPGTDRKALAVPAGATLVEAPSARILLLMRVLVTDDPTDLASAQVARASLRCGGEPRPPMSDASTASTRPSATSDPRSPTLFEAGADDPVRAFLDWRRTAITTGDTYADPDSPDCSIEAGSAKIALGAAVGSALIGDLNGDGRKDAYISPGTYLCDGGNAFTPDDFLVMSTASGYIVDDLRIIKARNAAGVDLAAFERLVSAPDGTVLLEGTGYQYKEDDPRCCPSVKTVVRYDARRDKVTVQ